MTNFEMRRTVMVDTQVRPSDVTKFPIIEAMLSVAREDFVPVAQREAAYMGENIDLGAGRVVLEPRTLAKMLDVLDIGNDELVLDIGVGYGYSSAVIAHMAEAVVAVEEDEDLAREAQEALMTAGADNVALHTGPLAEGAAQHGPYDVVIVQGGVARLPQALLDQIKDGGRIACLFMDGALGEVRVGYKIDGRISWRNAFNAGAPVLPGFEAHSQFQL
ncbi:protein-L-isoaspartate O-methyltransferase [Sulfitobacter pseudonitzschiae]|uniref:Protein-L-isoaspartate O-methyltransferase n=1 Tax=Pseudosulfitobacter pseudonitzschiae TaxID=1402135 RepID=A0A9Q2NNU6_9RHOB|nr:MULTISPECIES: protein-L-isoaspartate O-methyltransferase [Roseobacteraceae]MBM2291432.1 protein-L-isoaspartate O-methyltransferase [Pseudosulfitobacter pseudonitzschiae]MBM2296350.1 protein-L-isoaspartate O-methyltransferase [Pseudosulfitobacter pseudonitzschiae]MBM2301263.1 protein-L-isoaspartate O-methyltransferase [Pseudosulfitobacter pseudonitzschiae]MBM2311047.1 protein-L-isoaspartate O-methyltransferase [Pseudosulfitobacter pseudonitzschiae]MBM2315960.1 protein-L-isoaspartate O-methyl|tara:strand:+ start:6755 stop:7408 length:654 start_codon:yes stop_codon:yes gene_type:complete